MDATRTRPFRTPTVAHPPCPPSPTQSEPDRTRRLFRGIHGRLGQRATPKRTYPSPQGPGIRKLSLVEGAWLSSRILLCLSGEELHVKDASKGCSRDDLGFLYSQGRTKREYRSYLLRHRRCHPSLLKYRFRISFPREGLIGWPTTNALDSEAII